MVFRMLALVALWIFSHLEILTSFFMNSNKVTINFFVSVDFIIPFPSMAVEKPFLKRKHEINIVTLFINSSKLK